MSFKKLEKSPPIYYLGCQECPRCCETVFAAEGAELTPKTVRYRWVCDLCNHEFTSDAVLDHEMAA